LQDIHIRLQTSAIGVAPEDVPVQRGDCLLIHLGIPCYGEALTIFRRRGQFADHRFDRHIPVAEPTRVIRFGLPLGLTFEHGSINLIHHESRVCRARLLSHCRSRHPQQCGERECA